MNPTGSVSAAETWFKRVLWLGVIANLGLAVPTLIAPAQMMALSNFPPATPLLWPRFAALLLILLSVFYMFAGVATSEHEVESLSVGTWTAISGAAFTTGLGARTNLALSMCSSQAGLTVHNSLSSMMKKA